MLAGSLTKNREQVMVGERNGHGLDELAEKVTELARRNEALEDFAALVAHELKRPLLEVAYGGDPVAAASQALALVDAVLALATSGRRAEGTPVEDCLLAVLRDLGPLAPTVESAAGDEAPLPASAVSILLRNLLSNASSAGAHEVQVRTARTDSSWTLTVDDDGAGLGGGNYASGSGIGFGLCRRLVERFGGSLELEPRLGGGTRARLVVAGGVS